MLKPSPPSGAKLCRTKARRVPAVTTPNRFSSIAAFLVVIAGLLGTRVAHGADPQLIAIENAGDATLDDQSFHLPLFMSRQLAAIQGDAFPLAMLMPFDWLAGAFWGIPIGLSWADSMVESHEK